MMISFNFIFMGISNQGNSCSNLTANVVGQDNVEIQTFTASSG
ncbi:hypothetical protein EPIR_1004 [Erwinia piriflorinigrans CFBP 5888]|uniref:Uncharacterized protein n=1 Tax=Erwinia piriflorinigrans CFBP 5888 TaxID=1161919 RepID=V5Z5X2_9GAMM|nr:hypothetical protein EPIR_1004 [Erwinia piriflorinigrans CFBP 5888]